jgi:hypothetical protein
VTIMPALMTDLWTVMTMMSKHVFSDQKMMIFKGFNAKSKFFKSRETLPLLVKIRNLIVIVSAYGEGR